MSRVAAAGHLSSIGQSARPLSGRDISAAAIRASGVWSECSLGDFPNDCLVQLRIRQQPLQPDVLLLELCESLRLVHAHAAILLLLTVVVLLRHPDLLHRLGDGLLLPSSTSTSRSFGMICSACSGLPRGIS